MDVLRSKRLCSAVKCASGTAGSKWRDPAAALPLSMNWASGGLFFTVSALFPLRSGRNILVLSTSTHLLIFFFKCNNLSLWNMMVSLSLDLHHDLIFMIVIFMYTVEISRNTLYRKINISYNPNTEMFSCIFYVFKVFYIKSSQKASVFWRLLETSH